MNKKRKESLIKQGVCIRCKVRAAVDGVQRCEDCLVVAIAGQHGISSDMIWEKMKEQKNKCPYTGRRLEPGKNLSVDHIKPRSLYPELANDLTNIELVDYQVNIAKNNLSKDEFLKLVREIYRYLKL